jgi:predicted RNase H-like nuclease (RuvC/YqgF family)
MLKKTIPILLLCILTVSLSWTQDEAEKDEDAIKRIEKLTEQVEMLEKRIKSLEQQLRSLERLRIEIPKNFPKFKKLPEGWREHEFNGMTYYIVPLNTDKKKK